jgi:hypothetical protein
MLLCPIRFPGSVMRGVITLNRSSIFSYLCVIAFVLALAGCGGGGSSGPQGPPPPPPEVISVIVNPNSIQVMTGASQLFTAQVGGTGSFSASVTWSVNGVNGGNSTVGTIVGGEYTAPATLPSPSNVTIQATSVEFPAVFADAGWPRL